MRAATFALVAAALSWCAVARAESGEGFVAEARFGDHVIVNGPNLSGGWGPSATFGYGWAIDHRTAFRLGLDGTVYGLGRGSRWLGMAGGLMAQIAGQPSSTTPLVLSLAAKALYLHAPICNAWPKPLCPREHGLAPEATVGASYQTEAGVEIGGSFAVQFINGTQGLLLGYTPEAVFRFTFGKK